ncbi:RHS repeat domain-containing protein [Metapseudomonas otitidis]|uniref:RHS repeat domain-containing protein n=1 Tax=Metapseudomonas otitidis TaxID=319939 RepID=UPI003F4D4908
MRYTTDGKKKQASYYVWLDSLPIAQIDLTYSAGTTVTSTTLTYLHSDHLNTPRLATNQGGNLVWSWPSDAFGVEQPNNHGSTIDVILRFPGQIADAHSELFYNYFRDYDPETGRYVESDPIGLKGGLNTYGYTYQNPMRYTDPTGEAVPLLIWGGVTLADVLWAGAGTLAVAQIVNVVSEWGENSAAVSTASTDTDRKNCPDRCDKKLDEKFIESKGYDPHELKWSAIGQKNGGKFDLCGCEDGRIAVRRWGGARAMMSR